MIDQCLKYLAILIKDNWNELETYIRPNIRLINLISLARGKIKRTLWPFCLFVFVCFFCLFVWVCFVFLFFFFCMSMKKNIPPVISSSSLFSPRLSKVVLRLDDPLMSELSPSPIHIARGLGGTTPSWSPNWKIIKMLKMIASLMLLSSQHLQTNKKVFSV